MKHFLLSPKFLLFISLSLFSGTLLFAQTQPAVSTVNVSQLSNTQVQKAKEAMTSSGLTPQSAADIARQKGASEQQIQEMLKRMNQPETLQPAPNNPSSATTLPVESKLITAEPSGKEDPLQRKTDTETNGAIFGSYLFNSKNLTFEPNLNIQTPKNYTIGIGDQLIINVWGNTQSNFQLNVNKNGQVTIPEIGPIYVAGLLFESASEKIIDRLSSIYADMKSDRPNTFAQVNLGQLRSIIVNVVGEVGTPGSYTLPVTATLFNALYLSGGPSLNGSFRNIQIIRNGRIFKTIDVYKFLLNADPSDNILLQNDDIVFVPVYEKRVQTMGQFKRNAYFELKSNENLTDLFRFAGGFTDDSYQLRFQIRRMDADAIILKDVFTSDVATTQLENGDIVSSIKKMDLFKNRVLISGAVYRPGEYEITDGLTLSKLIIKADSLLPEAFQTRAIITRLNFDNSTTILSFDLSEVMNNGKDVLLQPEDIITIKSRFDLKQPEFIAVGGEVIMPGKFPFSENTTVSDAIFMAGGLKEGADSSYVEVARRPTYKEASVLTDTMQHIFVFKVNRDLSIDTKNDKFILEPFDIVSVRHMPGYKNPGIAEITGEVMYSGPFALQTKNDRISGLLRKAGGLTPYAQVSGATLTHNSIEFGVEKIAIDLQKIIDNPGCASDLFIQDGDIITIPRRMQTVKIIGNVLNPITTTYLPGQKLDYYVKQSGGFGERTRKNKIYIRYPNGTADITKSVMCFRVYPKVAPGCEIIIPEKVKKESSNTSQWISISSALSTLTIAIATVSNLLK